MAKIKPDHTAWLMRWEMDIAYQALLLACNMSTRKAIKYIGQAVIDIENERKCKGGE